MRGSLFCAIALAALCLVLAPAEARGQYAYGASGIGYDNGTKVVYGYSRTRVDYYAGAYYDPYVEGFLYDPYQLRDWGYSRGYESFVPAVVETAALTTPSTRYDVISDHYVISWYSVSVTVCDYYGFYGGCGYDPYGFSGFAGGGFGGFNYFYGGYGGYVPERTYYLGWTGISGITPPPDDCTTAAATTSTAPYSYEGGSKTTRETLTFASATNCPVPAWSARIHSTNTSEKIQGTTQKALLGASIPLRADPSDNNLTGATFEWKVDDAVKGTARTLTTSFSTLGSHTITLSITRNSVKRTASVTVVVEVPEVGTYAVDGQVTFEGDEFSPNVDRGSGCIDFFAPNWYLKLGCPYQGFTSAGMTVTASVKTVGKVISTRSESKLKLVQIVNTYMTRTNVSTGACQVMTKRTSKSDTTNGWMLDASDPYGVPERPATGTIDSSHSFYGTNVAMDDSPSLPLTDGYKWTVDDKFQVYLVYYTGADTAPQNQKALGVLEWSWGGSTTYNATNGTHSAVAGTLFPATNIKPLGRKLTPTNEGTGIRPYDTATVQSFVGNQANWKSCGTTPTAGGTNNTTFVSQSVAATMQPGQRYNVSVTMKNSGTATWNSSVYKLGSQNPQDNMTWGLNRVPLPSGVTVAPGASYTFNFTATAPTTPGLYNFRWRMVKEGVEWFGALSPNVSVNVAAPSACSLTAEEACYENAGDWNPATCKCTYTVDPCLAGAADPLEPSAQLAPITPCY